MALGARYGPPSRRAGAQAARNSSPLPPPAETATSQRLSSSICCSAARRDISTNQPRFLGAIPFQFSTSRYPSRAGAPRRQTIVGLAGAAEQATCPTLVEAQHHHRWDQASKQARISTSQSLITPHRAASFRTAPRTA